MKIVTLAQITLDRVGTASSPYTFPSRTAASGLIEVTDTRPETLREVVIDLAEKHGEARQKLNDLKHVIPHYKYTAEANATVFDIQSNNIQFGTPYAVCVLMSALKEGNRYFRLEEISP